MNEKPTERSSPLGTILISKNWEGQALRSALRGHKTDQSYTHGDFGASRRLQRTQVRKKTKVSINRSEPAMQTLDSDRGATVTGPPQEDTEPKRTAMTSTLKELNEHLETIPITCFTENCNEATLWEEWKEETSDYREWTENKQEKQ